MVFQYYLILFNLEYKLPNTTYMQKKKKNLKIHLEEFTTLYISLDMLQVSLYYPKVTNRNNRNEKKAI